MLSPTVGSTDVLSRVLAGGSAVVVRVCLFPLSTCVRVVGGCCGEIETLLLVGDVESFTRARLLVLGLAVLLDVVVRAGAPTISVVVVVVAAADGDFRGLGRSMLNLIVKQICLLIKSVSAV